MNLTENQAAPTFSGPTDTEGTISLNDFAGRNLVVFFYPKDMTPGCTNEAIDFSRLKPDFDAANTIILGVSKDSIARHEKFRAKHDLKCLLLSDEDGKMLETYGAWGEKKLYGKTYMGIIRSTILIDKTGKVRKVWPKVRVKGHADEVLSVVQEIA